MRASGAMILFVDADGATQFSDFARVEEELLRSTNVQNIIPEERSSFDWTFPAIVVGSRHAINMFFVFTVVCIYPVMLNNHHSIRERNSAFW